MPENKTQLIAHQKAHGFFGIWNQGKSGSGATPPTHSNQAAPRSENSSHFTLVGPLSLTPNVQFAAKIEANSGTLPNGRPTYALGLFFQFSFVSGQKADR
ncbi:MAG TPA: hypothetical protein VFX30_10080 [bacterium]|nr:hypothetical protein [bacterium]